MISGLRLLNFKCFEYQSFQFKPLTLLTGTDGLALWQCREELFPHLQFCSSVEAQLQAVLHGSVMLKPTLDRLFLLEQFCQQWVDGPFNSQKVGCRVNPESEATLNKYERERIFCCPDGEYRRFEWHIKLTPHAWRIHFFPLEDKRQLIIGYIGQHLPISTR
jgi:hypothetical protein